MNWVVFFDVVTAAAFLGCLLLVPRIPDRVLDRQARLFLGVCLGIYVFNGVSNTLQHSGITSFLDRFEVYAEILFVPCLLFFLFSAQGTWDERQRLRSEKALRLSEARFRELAELLPQLVFEADREGLLTFVNRQGFALTGYGPADLEAGLPVGRLLDSADWARARANADQAFAGDELRGAEYTIRRKDGSCFPGLVFTAPIWHTGDPVHARGIIVDASHAKQLETRLVQAQKLEAVGTLAGGVAHEFNNLLHAISGYMHLVLNGELTPENRRRLERADGACNRAADLVGRLLTFSRQSAPSLVALDLNHIVTRALATLENLLPKRIHLTTALAPGLWSVAGDAGQLEQVLQNLAGNARHAITGQGTFTIATANVELAAGDPGVTSDLPAGRYVRLTAQDDGAGMSAEVAQQAFDPFFSTKEVGQGSGLGLAVVYGIVRSHKGRIVCRSTPGVGTTFEIHLPAPRVLRAGSPAPPPRLPGPPPRPGR